MPSSFAAARQDPHVGPLTQQVVGHRRAGVEDVLAVIEEQQEPLVLDVLGERVGDWLARLFLHTQHRRHRLWYESRVRERREFHEPRAVRKLRE